MPTVAEHIRQALGAKAEALISRDHRALDDLIDAKFTYLNAGGKLFDKLGYIADRVPSVSRSNGYPRWRSSNWTAWRSPPCPLRTRSASMDRSSADASNPWRYSAIRRVAGNGSPARPCKFRIDRLVPDDEGIRGKRPKSLQANRNCRLKPLPSTAAGKNRGRVVGPHSSGGFQSRAGLRCIRPSATSSDMRPRTGRSEKH